MCVSIRLSLLIYFLCDYLKDTHKEKVTSNKTSALSKSMNIGHLGSWYIKSTLY